jgi:hypothetical protein
MGNVDYLTKLSAGLSFSFIEKAIKPGMDFTEAWQNFKPTVTTPDALAKHITTGQAFSAGIYAAGKRKNAGFICAWILPVDLDKDPRTTDQLLQIPLIRDHCAMVYRTPSYSEDAPRHRLVFILDEPVTGTERYRALVYGVMHELGLTIDPASAKPAQPFFGTLKQGNVIRPDKRLSLSQAGELTYGLAVKDDQQMDEWRQLAAAPKAKPTGSGAEKHAAESLETIFAHLASATRDRNEALMKYAIAAWSKVNWAGMTPDTIERGLYAAAVANGHVAKHGEKKTRDLIARMRQHAKDEPQVLPPSRKKPKPAAPEKNPLDWKPVKLHPIEGVTACNTPFVNQLDLSGNDDLLIKSDTGTGKTTAIAEQTAAGSVLFITHRRALSSNHAETVSRVSGRAVEDYNTIPAGFLASAPRMSICLNSVPKLASPTAPELPTYDTVVLDEGCQVLAHLDGDTFRGNEAETAYNTMKAIIKKARRLIVMDADADPILYRWAGEVRGKNPRVIENTYTRQRGKLTVCQHPDRVIEHALRIVEENSGVVVLPVGSVAKLEALQKVFAAAVGDDQVMAIYQHNPDQIRQQHFIDHIDEEISKYRVVLYTPTLGSGVDIQTPVRAVCGIFYSQPLTATEIHQMLNRCRNAQETIVHVQNVQGRAETSAEGLYKTAWENAIKTGMVTNFNNDGILVATDTQKSLLRLLSMIKADRNRSFNHLYDHFMTLARGYTSIVYDTAEPGSIKETVKQAKETGKALTLIAAPIDAAQYEMLASENKATAEVHAGFMRWKIERAAGQDITPQLYDQLHKPDQRSALRLLTDVLHARRTELALRDKHEANVKNKSGRLIHKRQHHVQRWQFLHGFINALYGSIATLSGERTFTGEEIAAAVEVSTNAADLYKLFNRRADLSKNPVAAAKFLFAQMGLKLESKRIRGDGERTTVYHLNTDNLTFMQALAKTSRARQEADEAAAEERRAAKERLSGSVTEGWPQTRSKYIGFDTRIGTGVVKPPQVTQCPYEDRAAIEANERRIAMLMMTFGGR